MSQIKIEWGDVVDRPNGSWLQRLAQLANFAFQLTGRCADWRKGDGAFLRHRPYEAPLAPEIERKQRLVLAQRRPHAFNGRRLGIDEITVARKAAADLGARLVAIATCLADRGVDRPHHCLIALLGR